MSKRNAMALGIGVLALATAGAAAAADLEYSVAGGEIELDWDSPGRSLRYVSDDGNLDLRPMVRLHVDAVGSDGDISELNDNLEVRKLRLALRARLYEDWRFKIDGEFSPDKKVDWRNFWLSYRGFERVDIKLGNQISPVSLEQAISSDNLTFMERSLADALTPSYQTGLSVRTWTPYNSFMAAVLYAPIFDNEDRHRSEGVSVASRFTFAPFNEYGRVLHLGASGEYRALDGDSTYRVRRRPESDATRHLISTGNLYTGDDAVTFGVEAAGVFGPFSLQGEYLYTHLMARGPNPTFDGGYVQASVFPTGESRPYNVGWGAFSWIVPKRRFGALELAARWSTLDLTDDGIRGGDERNVTVGANWYLNQNLRVMFNAVFVDADLRGSLLDDEPTLYQGRVQVIF